MLPATARLWLQPQVRLRQQCFLCIDSTAPEGDQRVGWGLEPWGDAGRYMSFAAGSVAQRSGVVDCFKSRVDACCLAANLVSACQASTS